MTIIVVIKRYYIFCITLCKNKFIAILCMIDKNFLILARDSVIVIKLY